MKWFILCFILCLEAPLFGMSPQQFQACLESGEIKFADVAPRNEQELEYAILYVLEIKLPEQEHVDQEYLVREDDAGDYSDCATMDHQEVRRQGEMPDFAVYTPSLGSGPRSSIPQADLISGFIYKDSSIWPLVALPDMQTDSEMARLKTEVERGNVEALSHEMQSLRKEIENRSILDRYNRFVLSRRLSFIVRSLRQNAALHYLFMIFNVGSLDEAVFGARLLSNVLERNESLIIDGNEVVLDDAKRAQLMQIARTIIMQRTDYQEERRQHPVASVGGELLPASPILNQIDLLFAKIPSAQAAPRGAAGKAEATDPFIELLRVKVNIHPDVNLLVQNGLANLQLNEPLFKQYLDATVSALEGMQKEGLLVVDPATVSLDTFKHGAKHYFKKLIPTNPLEHPKEYAVNLLKYSVLGAIHTSTGGVLVPVQIAAEVALRLHAIQSADTARMTPEQYAEFVAEELADITYQIAVNKLASSIKDSDIPKGFVRMTREMLKGEPEVAFAGGGSSSASAAAPEGPTVQTFARKKGRDGGAGAGAGAGAPREGAAVGELVANMGQLFEKNDFGRALERNSVRTKFQCSKMNSQVYKVTEKMPEYGLKKGDQFCLDTRHFDHIEVYNKRDVGLKALSIDGTEYKHSGDVVGRQLGKK